MTGEVQAEKITYGGVTFDKAQVKHMTSTTENNVTKYSVWLNDGTKLTYKDTPTDRNANVKQFGLENGKTRTEFSGLSRAEIRDTENDDVYFLMGCEFTTVDADRKKGGLIKKPADKDYILLRDRKMKDGTVQESNWNHFYLGENECANKNGLPKSRFNPVHKD